MTRAWWQNKRVLVVGMARSGRAAARLLSALGARAVLSDAKTDLEGMDAFLSLGCALRLGEPAEDLVRGCDAVIVSPAVPIDSPVAQRARELNVPLLGELEFGFGILRGTTIAVTGTNGKTTTATLLGELFQNAGKRTFVAGNIGLPLSAIALDSREEDFIIIEVSSFQLETVDTFRPDAAVLLNLTPDHLNRHGDMEAYAALKARIVRRQSERDLCVYNAEDAFCKATAEAGPARAVPFSRLHAQETGAWMEDGQLVVEGRTLLPASEIGIRGPHNLENALAAAATAAQFAVPAPVIRHTLRSFAGVEHRMETVRTLAGVRYVNDSKGTNPDSSIRAVEGADMPTVLIAGGDDKGSDFSGFARAIRENPLLEHVVLIGKTAERLQSALAAEGFSNTTMAGTDFERAVRTARTLSRDGGCVLLSPACASFDMFADYEQRGRIFKQIVNEMIE